MTVKTKPRRRRVIFSHADRQTIKSMLLEDKKVSDIAMAIDKPYNSTFQEIKTFGGRAHYSPAQSEKVHEGTQRITGFMVKALAEDVKEVKEMLKHLFHYLEVPPIEQSQE